jgi:5-methylcytosine-specific restriction protein B
MAKKIRSWSKPDNIENLIGIKKVDYSIFLYGIHIPVVFREDFLEANKNIEVDAGTSEELILMINGEEFKAELRNIQLTRGNREALQIRYDSNAVLKEYLKKIFQYSYSYISAEQERTGKSNVIIPDEDAEYIEFYKTDTPFKYIIKTVTKDTSIIGYPFRNIFDSAEDVRWTFSFIRNILLKLGITDGSDERFSVTLPKEKNSIHLNCYAWRLLGIRRMNAETSIELALLDKAVPLEPARHVFSFKQGEQEDSISIYSFPFNIIKDNEARVWSDLDAALANIKERFANIKKTNYLDSSVQSLEEAIFDAEALDKIIENGIEIGRETNIWIFQGKPSEYNITKALNNLSEIMWRVTRYKNQIKPGDKVYIWESGDDAGIIATAEVLTLPQHVRRTPEDASYRIGGQAVINDEFLGVVLKIRDVLPRKITKDKILGNSVLKDLMIIRSPQGINFYVKESEDRELMKIINNNRIVNPPVIDPDLNPPYSSLECAQDLGMEVEMVERWIRTIERKGQAILYGPPGTGKTYSARHIAKVLVAEGNGFVETLQFHPAYAYEDFVQGIRPVTENGALLYKLMNGRFIDFCERSRDRKGKCVLIIDEINRANLSRVFGELMYLLEYRSESIPLAGGKFFSIPANVYIIGTMNTADRSIAIVDHALRRRFAFFELTTNYSVLDNYHKETGFPVNKLITLLKQINAAIGDKRYEIGISYFMRDDLMEEIQDIWEMEIVPYLEEYFFDQPDKVTSFTWDKVEGVLSNEQ